MAHKDAKIMGTDGRHCTTEHLQIIVAYTSTVHLALRAVKYTVPSSFTSIPSLTAITPTRSTRRVEYPHSLSYQDTSLTKVGVSMMPASASKTVEHVSPTKSEETTWSSVYPTTPLASACEARFTSALISSYVVGVSSSHVRSTTNTSTVGTRNAMPVSLPFMTGYAFATALAAPVDDGMMLAEAVRPARQSLPFIELSTTIWEAVAAWTVVINPCLMPNFSLMTLTRGARPLVVQEAHETTFISVL